MFGATFDRALMGAMLVACGALAPPGCGDSDEAADTATAPDADAGPDTVDAGPDTVDAGPDTVDAGPDTVDAGPDTVDAGPDAQPPADIVVDTGPDTPQPTDTAADVGAMPDVNVALDTTVAAPTAVAAVDLGPGTCTSVASDGRLLGHLLSDDDMGTISLFWLAQDGARTDVTLPTSAGRLSIFGRPFMMPVPRVSAGDRLLGLADMPTLNPAIISYVEDDGVPPAPTIGGSPDGLVFSAGSWSTLTMPSGTRVAATSDANAGGAVVGMLLAADDGTMFPKLHAFIVDGGTVTTLPGLGGPTSVAYAINDGGAVVGSADLPDESDGMPGATRAAWWVGGVAADLGTLGGTSSVATDINNAGLVVGFSQVAGDAGLHAFHFANGAMTDLGTLGGAESYAHAVSEAGYIVGWSLNADGDERGFLYAAGAMTELTTAAGATTFVTTRAEGIRGDRVAGWGLTEAGAVHCLSWELSHD